MNLHTHDSNARERFVNEINHSFSVLAPAGVGKTHSIVQRIVALAQSPQLNQQRALRQLVVVTYTRKAAREMRERTLHAWAKQVRSGASGHDLEHVFFGTIHSFCLELIKDHGHVLGLNRRFELIDAQDPLLWEDFLASAVGMRIQSTYPEHPWIAKLLQFSDLVSVAQKLPAQYNKIPRVDDIPQALNFALIEHYQAPKPQLKRGVHKTQAALRNWQAAMAGAAFAPVGFMSFKTGGEDFIELCHEVFKPLKDWAGAQALALAHTIRACFKQYCAEQGWISYEDMVLLANKVLEDPSVAQHFCAHPLRIILDEAQDTDASQFTLLLRACGMELDTPEACVFKNTRAGLFCMVGDPQQAIYSSRTHVGVYEQLHTALIQHGALEELKFQVTYRCGEHIVSAINQVFAHVLSTSKPAQVAFNTLAALPQGHPGQVVRIALSPANAFAATAPESARALELAQRFAHWLKSQTLESMRAQGWEDVAILCPRNGWLECLASALDQVGIACQVRSKQGVALDNPAYAWAVALIAIMADPWDSFEVMGALREIFGLSDDEIAHYVREHACNGYQALQIAEAPLQSHNRVAQTLKQLHSLWLDVKVQPLTRAVNTLFERTQLLERLSSLPAINTDKARFTLQQLSSMAAGAQTAQLSFADFAKKLVAQSDNPTDDVEIEPGKVQLLTCHSAKGLQWSSVIVPYFFRPIAYACPRYPQLLYSERMDTAALKIDADHIWPALERALQNEACAELSRLIYVTMTRAKHSLVIVDDRAFWRGLSGSCLAHAAHMGFGEVNYAAFMAMPCVLKSDNASSDKAQPAAPTAAPQIIPYSTRTERASARKNSLNFRAQIFPSSLAQHTYAPHKQPFADHCLSGADYGNAWHALMQSLPWRASSKQLDAYFEKHLPSFPLPQRAIHEWGLFKEADFLKLLVDPAWSMRTELPFLAQVPGKQAAYQGVIDFVAYHPIQNKFLVIDWKTDALPLDGMESLVAAYRPQLEAYRTCVLQASAGCEVSLGLYSTREGILSWL